MHASNILKSELVKNGKREVSFIATEDFNEELFKQLKSELEKQSDQKRNLEDKAKSILGTISILMSAIIFSLGFAGLAKGWTWVGVLLVLSVLSFLMATIRSIQSLNIRMFYVYSSTIEIDNERNVVCFKKKTAYEEFHELLPAKIANSLIISGIANLTYASYILVRNGILLLGCFFLSELLNRGLSSDHKKLSNVKQEYLIDKKDSSIQSFPVKVADSSELQVERHLKQNTKVKLKAGSKDKKIE